MNDECIILYKDNIPKNIEVNNKVNKFMMYKRVKKEKDFENTKYVSFYNIKFEYILSEIIEARGCEDSSGLYLKFAGNELHQNKGSTKQCIIELEVDADDFMELGTNNNERVKKARFIREISEDEYNKIGGIYGETIQKIKRNGNKESEANFFDY